MLTAALCVLVTPGAARATEPSADDACRSAELAGAEVSTSVRLEHDDRTYTKVVTELTLDVPGTWPPARDLSLSEDSRQYIEAMSCLLGADDDHQRWSERRTRKPVVTWKGGRAKVVDEVYGWMDTQYVTEVGLWRVRPLGGEMWILELRAPPALWGARWDEVTVDPGRPGAERAEPEPKTGRGATALVWRPGRTEGVIVLADPEAEDAPEGLRVTVDIRPSWQRSWAARQDDVIGRMSGTVGTLLWVSTMSSLLLAAVRRYRRRPGIPTDLRLRTLGNLRDWTVLGVLSYVGAALAEADALPGFLVAMGTMALLFRFARPPRPIQRVLAAALVVCPTVLAVGLFAFRSENLDSSDGSYDGLGALVALQTGLSFFISGLLLLAVVAAAWRLATDGQLVPRSRRFQGLDRELRIGVAGPAVLVSTVVIAVCFALVYERNWQQASWLFSPSDPAYGEDHWADFGWQVMQSVTYVVTWLVLQHGWLTTSLAVIAVLRAWRAPGSLSPLHDRADGLLLLAFFALAVGLDVQDHLGSPLLEFLWIPFYALALYGATALLAHRSVLAQPFEISGRPLSTVAGPAARARLLGKARSYREIHAELRRLDQGLFGDVPPKREVLERKLHRLHNWAVNSAPEAAPDRLPAKVSVVDAALALGPRDDWWGNGVRGARFALIPGLPAAVLNTWAQWIRGEGWQNTLSDVLGLPDMAFTLVSWTVRFAAAGFVLGALWRVLPGRRGAVKAIPVTAAFALPVVIDVLVRWFTRESSANVALHVSTMLFVLTVTGIALDLDTFAGERRYWQTRLGLLLSVYQMRYYSLQVAYLIGQIIAIITIWQFFAEPDAVPSGGEAPPSSSNEGAGG